MYIGKGYVEAGHFFIGNDKKEASELFVKLEGNKIIADKVLLRLDLIERSEVEIDTVLGTIECNLSEISENVKLIIKEIFRMLNLE